MLCHRRHRLAIFMNIVPAMVSKSILMCRKVARCVVDAVENHEGRALYAELREAAAPVQHDLMKGHPAWPRPAETADPAGPLTPLAGRARNSFAYSNWAAVRDQAAYAPAYSRSIYAEADNHYYTDLKRILTKLRQSVYCGDNGVTPMADQIARTPKQVGEAVRRRRRSLGMTQKDIAGKTSLRPATISDGRGRGTGHAAAHAL